MLELSTKWYLISCQCYKLKACTVSGFQGFCMV